MSGPTRRTEAPVAKGVKYTTGEPDIQYEPGGRSVLIRHREYLLDIYGNQLDSFPTSSQPSYVGQRITPSNPALFPWLSNMSLLYETYVFNDLCFEYQPLCSTSSSGVVMMAIDYDASDEPPTSKAAIMSFESATKSSVWMEHTNRSLRKNLRKYPNYFTDFVNTSSDLSGARLRQNDVGKFYMVTIGTPATVMGELYVSYSIRFSTPQLSNAINSRSLNSRNTFADPFYQGTDFTGNLNILPGKSGVYDFTLQQPYSGLVILKGIGTGWTVTPTLSLQDGAGYVLTSLGEGINAAATNAFHLYYIQGDSGAIYEIASGTSTTRTGWGVLWASSLRPLLF